MKLKKLVGTVHLWLGLVCGLVVMISMTAAAVFVWDKELTDWYYHDYVFIDPQPTTKLPLATLFAMARKAVPGKAIESVDMANDPTRAYVFGTYKGNEHPQGWTHWADHVYWDRVYVNPYSGKVTGTVDVLTDWIDLTRRLHQNLLLRYDVGHYFVGFATLFVLMLVATGLVLWWPKNKAARKQRFTIKWNARWRRVNYDLHNVGGFYMNLFILLLGITGLVWTFEWWTNGIYRLLGDDPKTVYAEHTLPIARPGFSDEAMDRAFLHIVAQRPEWTGVGLYRHEPDSSGRVTPDRAEITGYVSFNSGSGWDESDEYFYHPTTGMLVHQDRQETKKLGAKWRNSNYAIHVGSIYGWPTKVLATLAALMLAGLPVTGFLIWWGRKKKAKPVSRKPAIRHEV